MTRSTADQLRACAARGLSRADAAREIGIPFAHVADIARIYGITFVVGTEARHRPRRTQYEACAAEGLTQAETARRLGVSSAAVTKVKRRWGLVYAVRHPGEGGRAPLAKLEDCAARGLTQSQAADELGVSRALVSIRAKRNGLVFEGFAALGDPVTVRAAVAQWSEPA